MVKRVTVDKKAFNPAYWPFLFAMQTVQIFFGGSSSGKSKFLLGQRVCIDMLKGGRNYLICRNVGKTNKTSTFNEIVKSINYYGLKNEFKINKTDMAITCKNGYQILFFGLDNIEKVKSTTPAKGVITDIVVEEATECAEAAITQLRLRLRGIARYRGEKIVKRIVLLFNPVDKRHWIHRVYFIGRWDDRKNIYADDNILIVKTTYRDNHFLESEDILCLESLTDKFWIDVYREGNWGVLGDLIFTNWQTADLSDIKNNLGTYYNGLDFGFGPDPTAFVRSGKSRGNIYITEELFVQGTHNKIIAPKLIKLINKEYVYCDCSDPRSISELDELGVNTLAVKKPAGSVEHGIRWLQGFNIYVHYELQNMINELTTYQYKKDKYGDSIRTPQDKDNHGIDALRYSYESEMVNSSIKFKSERY